MVPTKLKCLSICYCHTHFHLTPTVEVNEMHEKLEEMVPKITISDHNTIQIKFYSNRILIMINILHGNFWNVFILKMVVMWKGKCVAIETNISNI